MNRSKGSSSKGDQSSPSTVNAGQPVATKTSKFAKKKVKPEEILVCSHLERLKSALQWTSDDAVDMIRSSTCKIYSILRKTDENIGMDDSLPLLAIALTKTRDSDTIRNIIQIFQILVQKSSGQSSPFVTTLLANDITGALLRSLHFIKLSSDGDSIFLDIYALLAQFASKDPEFPMKAKRSDTMKLTVSILRKNFSRLPVIKPILQVLKAAAMSRPSSSYFGKECIYTLLCLMESMDRTQAGALKLILETLNQLTKRRANCREVVLLSGATKLLSLLEHWERLEGINKIRIFRSSLQCLNNITDLRIGRNAIIEAKGVPLLYRLCHSLPISPEFDTVISQMSFVILKCLPPKWLPLKNFFSAVSFEVPEKVDEIQMRAKQTMDILASEYSPEDDTCSSSSDETDEEKATEECEGECCKPPCTLPRDLSASELAFYKQFLTEFESVQSRPLDPGIDDWSSDSSRQSPADVNHRPIQSDKACKLSDADLPSILSCINLFKSTAADHGCQKATEFSDLTMSEYSSSLCNCCSLQSGGGSCRTCKTFRNSRFLDDIKQSMKERKQIDQFIQTFDFAEHYEENSQYTRHVAPFDKLAYPEMHADRFVRYQEPLYHRDNLVSRTKILESLDRMFEKAPIQQRVAYDYDAAVFAQDAKKECLENHDPSRLGRVEEPQGFLKFESRFECGNLRKATMIGPHSYELILNPDINSDHHHQWFYFEVSNMEAGVPYLFYIVNCEKGTSQFSYGMKPVLYSVKEAVMGRLGWSRCGTNICYYGNHYSCLPGSKGRTYFTVHFSIVFQHSYDVCYIAYHYPYSYTLLKNHLQLWDNCHNKKTVYFRRQVLCQTLNQNDVPLLTITSANPSDVHKRPVVFLSARVHPGETNSSWIMKGTVDFLLSDKPSAETLRENVIFKIIPMLNPDGVINGCHRCSLSAEDLNRCWSCPSPSVQPTVYHAKSLLVALKQLGKLPLVFCDYHGHSRRKNVFLFGCNGQYSWSLNDVQRNNAYVEVLPKILNNLAPSFSILNCSFVIARNRETTARVTIWRQLGVQLSYTMESSYCGCDQGPYKDYHLGISQLLEMGCKFCQGIQHLLDKLETFKESRSLERSTRSRDSFEEELLKVEQFVGRADA